MHHSHTGAESWGPAEAFPDSPKEAKLPNLWEGQCQQCPGMGIICSRCCPAGNHSSGGFGLSHTAALGSCHSQTPPPLGFAQLRKPEPSLLPSALLVPSPYFTPCPKSAPAPGEEHLGLDKRAEFALGAARGCQAGVTMAPSNEDLFLASKRTDLGAGSYSKEAVPSQRVGSENLFGWKRAPGPSSPACA